MVAQESVPAGTVRFDVVEDKLAPAFTQAPASVQDMTPADAEG